MWYSWLHSCPVEYGALLRSHSKRSIGHSGSICFLMKSTRSLIRLCCDVQVRPYRISFFGKWLKINVWFLRGQRHFQHKQRLQSGMRFWAAPKRFAGRSLWWLGWNLEGLPLARVLRRGVKCCPWGGATITPFTARVSARPPLDATRPTARG